LTDDAWIDADPAWGPAGEEETSRRPARARVTIDAQPMWRIRLVRELPRVLLLVTSIAGLAASARFAIAPPRPAAPTRERVSAPAQDLAAEGFAQLFARRYLTWDANASEAHQRVLAPFAGTGMEAGVGLQPASSGEERVQWTEVVQERQATPGEHVYTVAVQTDTAGLQYLAVSVRRGPGGALQLAGYPAFVGPPASAPASVAGGLREVSDPALATVVERALRNYLAGSASELAADLSGEARVSLPTQPLTLEAMPRLDWSAEGGDAVTATVQAQDARGVRYTLAYDLDVVQIAGRWEVAAIQMDPDA
jgi:Conjugative transposon protein TcpC